MIVPDGRTDVEKLRELLGNPEETHLELKAKVDFQADEDKLKFVKDAVTMSHRHPGGYILIGVDNDGKPCAPVGTIPDRSHFDASRVQSHIRRYIEGEVHVLVQLHEIDGDEIVLVFVQQNRDRLPVPFSKDGQYQGSNGKSVTVFRAGEIFVREGAENVPLRYAHWHDILSAYAEKIRQDAGATTQALLNEVLVARQQETGQSALVPLLMDMDESTFAASTVALLEIGDDVRLRQFIRSFPAKVGPSVGVEEFTAALDKWTIFSAQALHFERPDLVEEAIRKLHEFYKSLGVDDLAIRKRFVVVTRLYVLGALAVRLEAWETIRVLVLRPVPSSVNDQGYIYSSWIRNATVFVARAGHLTFDAEHPERQSRSGFILSAARDLMVDHPTMRPDLTDDQVSAEGLTAHDIALNSLCEFDIAYCFIVAAMGTNHGSAYPSSAAFDADRANPMAQRLVADQGVRKRMFPGVSDSVIAQAMDEMYEIAIRESANNYGGRWWSPPPTVDLWVRENRPIQ